MHTPGGRVTIEAKPEALVRGLADRLYRQALAGGGWAADIGALGPRAFERDARWMVAEVALGDPPAP
jgi:hypothetical protein